MKELSIEQKAEAYDKAIKVIKDNLNALNEIIETGAEIVNIQAIKNCFYRAFPELKENKPQDKSALEAIKEEIEPKILGIGVEHVSGTLKECLDKVTSKFNVGDILKHNKANIVCKVISANAGFYCLKNILGGDEIELNNVEKNFHLWTIRDAKDGDILSWDNSKCIAIFKSVYDEEFFNSHGFVGHCTGAFESRLSYHDIKGAHPSTKEQRDFLFTKIKEAGYEWNAEKKELKNIEPHPSECSCWKRFAR